MNFTLNAIKYEDVRSQIIEYLKSNSEFSGQFDFTASNIGIIVDAMSYVTMLMSYQISNVSNNMFLDTTSLRKNAVSIAKTMGYRPRRAISSKIYGTIEYLDTTQTFNTETITIPANSIFVSDSGYEYINTEDIILKVDKSNLSLLIAEVILTEGIYKDYTYLGNGIEHQSFVISSKKIEENNFNLYVYGNTSTIVGEAWEEVRKSFNLLNKNSYFVEEDLLSEGYVKVVFGDGIISNFPSTNQIVLVRYLETNSTLATGSRLLTIPTTYIESGGVSGTFTSFDPVNFKDIATTTGKSYGAKAIETLEEIKVSAPKSFASAGRAVTQNDYETILNQMAMVYKSNVIGGDKLFERQSQYLGQIFISAIPYFSFDNILLPSEPIYISSLQEIGIYNELNKYRVVSTQLNNLKPSYIYINITPVIETKSNITPLEKVTLGKEVVAALKQFNIETYNDFETVFRASRLNSVVSRINNVLSADFIAEYYLILTKESFSITDTNEIYLPVMIDTDGNYVNFVKTNKDQELQKGVTSLTQEQRTIYGVIKNSANITRVLYSEDTSDANYATLKVDSKKSLFSFYYFTDPTKINVEVSTDWGTDLTVDIVPDVLPEQFTIKYQTNEFGTVFRTNAFDGGRQSKLIFSGADVNLTNPTNGIFYECAASFVVTPTNNPLFLIDGVNETFNIGDYVIFDSSKVRTTGTPSISGAYIKAKFGNVSGETSAENDVDLFSNITQNVSYTVSGAAVSGNFDGYILSSVSSGDKIIFNTTFYNAAGKNIHNWYKVNQITTPILSTDNKLPTSVSDFIVKKVTNIESNTTTTFDNQTASAFNLNDIIYYDNSVSSIPEADKWKLLVNSEAVTGLNSIDASINLDNLYIYASAPPAIGTSFYVVGIGNFDNNINSDCKIDWPTTEEIAYDFDVIMYAGIINGVHTWKIWQELDLFNIDGTIPTELPTKLTYGDVFDYNGIGDFQGQLVNFSTTADGILYAGTKVNDIGQTVDSWVEYIIEDKPPLNFATSASLPKEAAVGTMYKVVRDGTFNNPLMVTLPTTAGFIQGDYIIYNGSKFVIRNEYSFKYADAIETTEFGVISGRTFINKVMNLNSVFRYSYSSEATDRYTMFFDDIYNNIEIGTFCYNSPASYEVGKITFRESITGQYDYVHQTYGQKVKDLFGNDKNLIRFLPKNKLDSKNVQTTEEETNFNANFSTVTTLNINEAVIKS